MQTQLDYQVSDQALQVSPFRMAVALAVAGPSAILVWGINFALAHWYFPVYWCSVISKYDGSKSYCWSGPASFFNWLFGIGFLVFAFNAFLFVVSRAGIGDPQNCDP